MRLVLSCIVALALGALVLAQGVDSTLLLKPPADSWPTYHGDYSGAHHSKLNQISPANVGRLMQAWKFQTSSSVKSTPILVNGVLYVSSPDNVWAIDARTAKELW